MAHLCQLWNLRRFRLFDYFKRRSSYLRDFLLTNIALVFLVLIFIPNYFHTSFILLINSASYFSFPANDAVSSAYLRLL